MLNDLEPFPFVILVITLVYMNVTIIVKLDYGVKLLGLKILFIVSSTLQQREQ